MYAVQSVIMWDVYIVNISNQCIIVIMNMPFMPSVEDMVNINFYQLHEVLLH